MITNSLTLVPPSTADKMPEADPPALPTLKTTGWLVPPTVEVNGAGLGAMVSIAGVTTVVVTDTFFTVVPALHTRASFFAPGVAALNMKP